MQRVARTVAIVLMGILVVTATRLEAVEREVHVGVFDVRPLVFHEGDRTQGLFVDLFEAVASEQDWRVTYVPGTWQECLERLSAGEIDLLFSVARSPARAVTLDFNAQPVVTLWSQVYLRPGAAVDGIFDLDGEAVAIMRGDMNGDNYRRFSGRFGIDSDLVEVESLPAVFEAVRTGEVMAGVVPNVFGFAHADRYGLVASPIVFEPFPVYFATTHNRNRDLLAALDRQLTDWRESEGSYYHERSNAWLGSTSEVRREVPGWLIAALVGVGAVALLLVLWNRILEHRVRARTRDLQLSEARFRAVFETAGDAIFVIRDEKFVECNPRTLEMFGCRREDIIGARPGEFSPPEQPDGTPSSEAATARLDAACNVGPLSFEWRHRRPDSSIFDADVTLNAFRLGDDEYVQAFVRDITRRKQLEANLRQAQKMEAVGTLAGGIAHDFNNILSVIMGYNELAQFEAENETDLSKYLVQIGYAAERARDLVQQILAFSRRSAENKRPIDLADVLEDALRLLRSSIPSTVRIEQDITTSGRVFANPTSLHQIVMNLCTNAFQAMSGAAGTLKLSLTETLPRGDNSHRRVVLTVTDDGPGMPSDVVAKIFEPYFTTKAADRGSGLGLAVVHGIVEDHGGTIDVVSAPGRGTTFRVQLPGSDRPLPDEADTDIPVRQPVGGERVLFVDDEASIVDVFERGLERMGYQVRACTRPHEALEILHDDPSSIDVLVTDMTMPGMTGAALARAALALRPDLCILLCTGYSDGMTIDAARELGIRDLVTKPIDVSRLAHRIRMVLAGTP